MKNNRDKVREDFQKIREALIQLTESSWLIEDLPASICLVSDRISNEKHILAIKHIFIDKLKLLKENSAADSLIKLQKNHGEKITWRFVISDKINSQTVEHIEKYFHGKILERQQHEAEGKYFCKILNSLTSGTWVLYAPENQLLKKPLLFADHSLEMKISVKDKLEPMLHHWCEENSLSTISFEQRKINGTAKYVISVDQLATVLPGYHKKLQTQNHETLQLQQIILEELTNQMNNFSIQSNGQQAQINQLSSDAKQTMQIIRELQIHAGASDAIEEDFQSIVEKVEQLQQSCHQLFSSLSTTQPLTTEWAATKETQDTISQLHTIFAKPHELNMSSNTNPNQLS